MGSTTLFDSFSLFDDAAAQCKTQSSPCSSPVQAPPLHTLLLTSSLPSGAAIAASSIATTAATSSTNNQHLSRSNTPLQTQGLSVFDAFGKTKSQTPTIITGPTDFKDDPFKDYRYEDPFNIKDPFADDDSEDAAAPGTKQNFKEDFSSEDDTMPRNCNDKPKTMTSPSIKMLHQFDAFNLNASPVPSQKSTTSNSKPSQMTLDAFADFDDIIVDKKPTATSKSTKQNDAFFDAFDDTFNGNQNIVPKANTIKPADANAKHQTSTGGFDAFAAIKSSSNNNNNKSITVEDNLFNAFNDNNFEDCFNNKPLASPTLDNDFAKFDAFEVHNFSNDFTKAFNNTNNESATKKEYTVKTKDKFAADYSKPENFDADLEEALKRSMLDN